VNSGQPEVDERSWTITASARGMGLVFGDIDCATTGFGRRFNRFISDLRAQWSEEKTSVQFFGCARTRAFVLAPLLENDETINIMFDYMPEILPGLVRETMTTEFFYWVTGEMPGYPEVLIVVGAGIGGERTIGWLAIERDADNHEELGPWTPFSPDDEEYKLYASSWVMSLFDPPPPFH
jgi:hypothetical protein